MQRRVGLSPLENDKVLEAFGRELGVKVETVEGYLAGVEGVEYLELDGG